MNNLKDTFGYIIAFIIPGLVVLGAISLHVPELKHLLVFVKDSASFGVLGFIFVLGTGMVVFAYWAIIFRIGAIIFSFQTLKPEDIAVIEDQRLGTHEKNYEPLFRHYQFYGSMFIALLAFSIAYVYSPTVEGNKVFVVILCTVSAFVCLPISLHSYYNYRVRVLALAPLKAEKEKEND